MNTADLMDAVAGYVGCALWSSVDGNGRPLDQPGFHLPPELRADLASDVHAFARAHPGLCREALGRPGYTARRLGHDLWLTRNRHGAGFFDREALADEHRQHGCTKGLAERLTNAALDMGERTLTATSGIVELLA